MLRWVRSVVERKTLGLPYASPPAGLTQTLFKYRELGVFVTIKRQGDLRGCLGCQAPQSDTPINLLTKYAMAAATRDPRFPSVTADELSLLTYSITWLYPKEPFNELSEFKLGEDGVVIEYGGKGALFLPDVAIEQRWSVEKLLSECCKKAGLGDRMWLINKDVRKYKFKSESIVE